MEAVGNTCQRHTGTGKDFHVNFRLYAMKWEEKKQKPAERPIKKLTFQAPVSAWICIH